MRIITPSFFDRMVTIFIAVFTVIFMSQLRANGEPAPRQTFPITMWTFIPGPAGCEDTLVISFKTQSGIIRTMKLLPSQCPIKYYVRPGTFGFDVTDRGVQYYYRPRGMVMTQPWPFPKFLPPTPVSNTHLVVS